MPRVIAQWKRKPDRAIDPHQCGRPRRTWPDLEDSPTFSITDWLADGSTLPHGIVLQSRRRFGELSKR